ncbi:MAG: gas vesicle protein GvpG [Chlorobiaceae bacterium]|nr:gas vesicle protein GvpG [Chlorobiaceae bacterium]
MFIIDDILFAPLNGLIFIAEKINDVVEKETSDEGTVKERLMALQLRFELDEIDEEEYDREEDNLLKKLERIRSDKQNS